ncbi:MAG: formylglycine-generating enzyme family protein [Cyanobacteria bacterium P01_G01_bin.54]
MVISDCVSAPWYDGRMRALMQQWSARLPTVILQVFPERLWGRTALGQFTLVKLQGKAAGLPSDQLRPVARSYWDRAEVAQSQTLETMKIPVVTAEPDALGGLAQVVAGYAQARVLGILWEAEDWDEADEEDDLEEAEEAQTVEDWEAYLEAFLLLASPPARELAACLASAPVITLPIMRLIKQSMLRRSATAVHLAEVLMSGLFRVSGSQALSFENAERVAYELVDEAVRDRLRAGTRVRDAVAVLERVSQYVALGLGRSVYDFKALLKKPGEGETDEEVEFLDAFATVTSNILRGLGSEFEEIADQLLSPDITSQEVKSEYSGFPPLEDLQVIDADIVFEDDAQPTRPASSRLIVVKRLKVRTLKPIVLKTLAFEASPAPQTAGPPTNESGLEQFDFRIATLNQQNNQWVVDYRLGQAWRYVEKIKTQRLLVFSNSADLEMVFIPGGEFFMGAPNNEPEYHRSEFPQHHVMVPSFFMGRYPITQRQWRAVAAFDPVKQELEHDPSMFKGDNRPVEQVSWEEAKEFCARLSQHTQRAYRLPSEAEWEYACRAVGSEELSVINGDLTLEEWNKRFSEPFNFGEIITTNVANYNGSAFANGSKGKSRGKTNLVGEFKHANAFGLSEMHGNVWEWCLDRWHSNYLGAPRDGRAWTEGDDNVFVLRSGSWYSHPKFCRSASRDGNLRDNYYSDIGFRVVCTV